MTGSPDQPGIIRQMNEEMFTKIAATQAMLHSYHPHSLA